MTERRAFIAYSSAALAAGLSGLAPAADNGAAAPALVRAEERKAPC